MATLQHLPGNQRAALLLFDVLGFSAAEIAEMMKTSTASVDSALQRARAVFAKRAPSSSQQQALRTLNDARLCELVTGFATALQRGDANALVALLSADVTWSMPPLPNWYHGIDTVRAFARAVPFGSCGQWRAIELTAIAQPAIGLYLCTDRNDEYQAWSLNVLSVHDDAIGEVTSFFGAEHLGRSGLPTTI